VVVSLCATRRFGKQTRHHPVKNSVAGHRLTHARRLVERHQVLGLAGMTFVLTWIFKRLVFVDGSGRCSRPERFPKRKRGWIASTPAGRVTDGEERFPPDRQEVEWFVVQSAVH